MIAVKHSHKYGVCLH